MLGLALAAPAAAGRAQTHRPVSVSAQASAVLAHPDEVTVTRFSQSGLR